MGRKFWYHEIIRNQNSEIKFTFVFIFALPNNGATVSQFLTPLPFPHNGWTNTCNVINPNNRPTMRRRNILSMSSQVLWWSRGEEMHHIYHQVLWSIAFIVYACHETLEPIFAGLQVFVTKNIFTRYPWRRTFSCSGNPMYNKSVHLHEHMILLRRYI